jgi:4-hydroxy-tetrahydrodipicolinate synthase
MSETFEGVITALVTPFYKGNVDEESFVKLLHHQIDGGVSGIVVNGTTAESPTLKLDEVKRLFDIAKTEIKGRVRLIVGTGTNSTASTVELTQNAEKWGAEAALVVVPYYNRPPQRGLVAHFSTVARATKLPVILYNVPTRTSCSLEMGTVAKLADEKNIVGIKEASGNLALLEELKGISKKPFCLLSGDDGSGVVFCFRGGHGIISVISNLIPKELTNLVKDARAKKSSANQDYKKFDDLMKWLYVEANPIPAKWALAQMGIIRSAELRLPLVALDEAHEKGFRSCLQNLKLI